MRRMGAHQVTVHCPIDGEVKVWSTGLAMLLYPDDSGHYTFRCPGNCGEVYARPASPAIVRLLRSVHITESRIHPHRDVDATVLTEDDLIRFGRELEGGADPWLELRRSSSLPS